MKQAIDTGDSLDEFLENYPEWKIPISAILHYFLYNTLKMKKIKGEQICGCQWLRMELEAWEGCNCDTNSNMRNLFGVGTGPYLDCG